MSRASATPSFLMCLLACGSGMSGGAPRLRTLGPARQYSTNGVQVGKTIIGDLNGDGRNDVVTIEAGGYGQQILIFYQGLDGTLYPATVRTTPDLAIRSAAIGDVNGDRRDDLVISGLSTTALSGHRGRVIVFLQDTAGSLLPGIPYVVGSDGVGDVAIGDLNSDGLNDLAVLGDWTTRPGMGNLSIFYQGSDHTLGPESIYDDVAVMKTGEIHLADMNGDGRNDVILQSAPLSIAVIKQTSAGGLDPVPDQYQVLTSYETTFEAFAVGDLTGDGLADIAVLDPGNGGYVNLFVQGAGGRLSRTIAATLEQAPYGLEIADVDGDGLADLAGDVVWPGFPALGAVEVFRQTRDHKLAASTRFTFETISGGGSSEHRSLAIGDVTGDGFPDAVMTWANEGLWVLPSVPAR